jgi:hypothetical protein
VTSALLKLEEYFGESLKRHLIRALRLESLTDLMILTVDASQIAQSEKYVSGAAVSRKGGFFAKMGSVSRDDWKKSRIASGDLIVQPINIAVSRADPATGEHLHESPTALG